MELNNLNKQQKIFLVFVLPGFLAVIVMVSYLIFGTEETKGNSQAIGLNTSLPTTPSNIEGERIKAYERQAYQEKSASRKTNDFVLGNYAILSEEEKIQREEANGGKDKLGEVREQLIAEQKAIETFDGHETYDAKKVKAKKKRQSNEAPKEKTPPAKTNEVSFNSISLGSKSNKININHGTLAYIHGNQTIYHGGAVKIRTGKELVLPGGEKIPANTFLYGKCMLVGERMNINIQRVQIGSNIINCNLTGYGTDGNPGIYVPGSIQKEENKKSSAKGLKKIGSVLGAGVSIASGGILGDIAETATEGVIDAVTDGSAKSIQQAKVYLPNNERIYLK